MIPVKYDLADNNVKAALVQYNNFVIHFRDTTLHNAIKRGYVGYRSKDKQGHDTTLYLRGDDVKLAKWLKSHIVAIANMDAIHMVRFVEIMNRVWNVSGTPSRLKWLKHLFIENGFDAGSFPKDALVIAANNNVCPYCNRNVVGYVDIRKVENGKIVTKSIKGQLDHFYYKAKYPYLAISRNNLIPCCKDCNEHPNKLTEDAIATNLVNPFLINNPDGLLFRIDYPWDLVGCKVKESDITIGINTSANPFFARNVYTFGLDTLYNRFHKDVAVRVNNAYVFTQNRKYRDAIDGMTQDLTSQKQDDYQSFKEACGVVDKSQFGNIVLSKIATDIWFQLENGL